MIKTILFIPIISLILCGCSSFVLEEKPVSCASDRLSKDEARNIPKQIVQHFIRQKSLENLEKDTIIARLLIDKNGVIEKVNIESINCHHNNHKACEILINNLKEAIKNSGPLKNLPEDKYELWKELVLQIVIIDPKSFKVCLCY